MAANTPTGFFNGFDQLCDPDEHQLVYVIKGGPGTGKSTLMRAIGQAAEEKGYSCEYIHCSADPSSLDGLILGNRCIAVADGTPPHALEPKYPGAFERVISLNELFDTPYLEKQLPKLMPLVAENAALHKRAGCFLAAAGALKNESVRLCNRFLLQEKLEKYAKGLPIQPAGNGKQGVRHKRFLTAVSCDGEVFFWQTVRASCQKLIAIDDPYGSAAAALLERLAARFLAAGHEIWTANCPLSPTGRMEHLWVPALGVGYVTCNARHHLPKGVADRTIHAARFYAAQPLEAHGKKLQFYQKAMGDLVAQAAEVEAEAKQNHDKIEAIYTPAVHFTQNKDFFDRAAEQVLSELAKRQPLK